MASTYLQLTNRLLRQFNEVEMTESDWNGAKGIQAFAKDSIKMAIQEIAAENRAWENTVTTVDVVLDSGDRTFNIYDNVSLTSTPKHVGVESFEVMRETDKIPSKLEPLDYDEWKRKYLSDDVGAGSSGNGYPKYIYRIDATTWGVSPVPDETVQVSYKKYNYFNNSLEATATTTIPENYEYVIHLGAMVYFNMLLDNQEQSQMLVPKFEKAVKNMRIHLTNDEIKMYDTRVRF